MKSIKITPTQAIRLGLRPLVGHAAACQPRGSYYSNRGVAICKPKDNQWQYSNPK